MPKPRGTLSQADRERLIDELVYETLGLGPLEPLMGDPTISDILINGPHTIYVERRGKLERTQARFLDLDHLLNIVQRIAGRVGRRIDEASPMVDARLPDGSRVNAIMRPLALDGALVSIRRFSARPLTAGDLVARKSATPEMIDFLAACVKARLNIMVSGGTGSGKTTLLEHAVRLHSGQRADRHDRRRRGTAASAAARGAAGDAARQPGRPRRSHFPRSAAQRPADAARPHHRRRVPRQGGVRHAAGHEHRPRRRHDHDPRQRRAGRGRRLEMLVGMAAPELPMWFIHRQIASAIQIVVQTARLSGGARKITQIAEITGHQGDSISMHDIFLFEQTGLNDRMEAEGHFQSTGIRPQCLARLQKSGVDLARYDVRARAASPRLRCAIERALSLDKVTL